jgi:hypothetical protein
MKAPIVEPTPLIKLQWPLNDEPCLEDWTLLGAGTEPFMLHDVTGTVFQIGYDPDLIIAGERITIFVLYALVFFVDEIAPPDLMQIRNLGREAILAFWMLLTDRNARCMDLSSAVTFPEFVDRKEAEDAVQSRL